MNFKDILLVLATLLMVLAVIAVLVQDDKLTGIWLMSLAIFNLIGSNSCNKTKNGVKTK